MFDNFFFDDRQKKTLNKRTFPISRHISSVYVSITKQRTCLLLNNEQGQRGI